MFPNQFFDRFYWAVSDPQPDEFRGAPVKQTSRLKIRIFRHDAETISFGILPDLCIGRIAQVDLANMGAFGVDIG
jgi:hypothetical protein